MINLKITIMPWLNLNSFLFSYEERVAAMVSNFTDLFPNWIKCNIPTQSINHKSNDCSILPFALINRQ